MIDSESMRAFLQANQMILVTKENVKALLDAMESLKCPVDDDLIEATNHMNDCCQVLVRRYLQEGM